MRSLSVTGTIRQGNVSVLADEHALTDVQSVVVGLVPLAAAAGSDPVVVAAGLDPVEAAADLDLAAAAAGLDPDEAAVGLDSDCQTQGRGDVGNADFGV